MYVSSKGLVVGTELTFVQSQKSTHKEESILGYKNPLTSVICIDPFAHTCLHAKQPVHNSCEHNLLSINNIIIQIIGYKHLPHSDIVLAPCT